MTKQEFILDVNNSRKGIKNNWYYWKGEVEGKHVLIKGYNTWLQVFEVNGKRIDGPMDISVKEFNNILFEGVK